MLRCLIVFLFPITLFSQVDENLFTVFYNVENLFDTIDNPNTNDQDFLPNAKRQYNTYKYKHKLQQLARVFGAIKKIKTIINMIL